MPVKLERSSPCLEDLPTASVSSPFSGKCEETAIDAPIKAGAGKALPSVPLSQAHKAELELIFAQDQRLPSLASRQAWATARNTNLSSVNSWFFRKRYRTLSLQGIKLPEGTYNLPIETPNLSNPTVQESGDKLVPVKRELASPPAAKRPSKRRKVAHTRPTEGKKPPLMPQNLAKVTTTTPKDDTTGDSGVNRCSQRETLHIGSSRTSSGAYTQVSGSEETKTQNQKDREAPPVKRKRIPELCEATQAVLESKPCFPKDTNADVSSPVLDGPQDIPVLRPPSSVSSRPGTPEKPPKPVRPVESAPAVQRGSGRNPNASTEGAGHAGTIVSKAEKTNAGVAEPEGPLKKICKRRKPTTGNNRKMPKGKASKSKTKGVAKASTCDVEDESKVVPAAAALTKPQKRQASKRRGNAKAVSTLNAKDVATPTDSCPQIQSPSSPPELYSKISVTTRHSPTARVRSQDTKRRVTFQLPQTPRRRPVKSLTPVAPTKFKDKGYLRPSTLSSRSTRNRNKTTSHRHCPTGSSPLMKSSDTLVASPSSPSPTLDPDLDENKLNKIPSLYDTLLPGHGNEKDETSIEFESDGAASQDTSNTTINCEEEANLEECEHAIGDFGPPRTQVFNELELRLFGDIQWDDNQETWDGSGWELSAIPWLAYVGCGVL